MAHRSQCSTLGDVDNDPNHVPPHYKEYYRIAIDLLAEEGIDAYYRFLAEEKEVDFLSSTEIEHINKHLKKPVVPLDELQFVVGDCDESDSSGTYWPVHTDIAAPALDLGWPNIHMCRGPSDVTIFVHPPAPDTLSIKEEVRRLIRSATQVIAIVMDIFTDIDLFAEVLEAANRGVPVYLLLDELLSHHFLDMVKKCQVNLSHIHFLRVRTLTGSTYICRSGMSFTGNLIERFMLVDCSAVLCGSYSFMWAFEKIHRSIVQRFQGELVAIFDEEFRILFAQSNPLPGVENLIPEPDNFYTVKPYQPTDRWRRKQSPRLVHQEDMLSQHSGYSWADPDRDHFGHNFRQNDVFRQIKEESGIRGSMRQFAHVQQEDFQLDPTSSALLRAKQMEMKAFKRRSYAEGTFESYDSMVQRYGRISDHYDELDARSEQLFREKRYPLEPGLTRNRFSSFNSKHVKDGLGILERFRQNRTTQHQYNESAEQPRHWYDRKNHEEACLIGLPLYPPPVNYEPSNSSKEVRHGSSDLDPVADGRLGQKIQKRPNIGQSYACQKSPTQKQVLDPKMLFTESSLGRKSDDQPTKHGLRRWRIGSYFRDQDEHPTQLEDVSAPDESQNNNEVLYDSRQNRAPFEKPLFKESAQITSYKHLDLYNSKSPKTDLFDDQSLSSDKGNEERNVKLAKHESMRSKLNPMLQRSRLRSSLIFNNSKAEQHITQKGKGIQSIREQKQEEEKESKGIQESKAAADFQENSTNDQTKPIQYSMPGKTLPNEIPKTSEPNLKESFTGKKLDLDMGWQQTDSAFSSHDPDTRSSDQHGARSKVDLQLSKKVQDAINKMTQRTSLSKEIKTPHIQSAKTEKPPLEKPGKAINSAARQQGPPPSELTVGSLQPGLPPSESATLNNARNPQRSSSTLKLEDADGNLAKTKMHSSTVCLDTREGKEDESGGESAILNSISKSPSRLKSFLNLPGDTKSKEMQNNVDLAQPLTSVKENEKNPEKLSKTVQSEVVLSNSEKEEKPRRPPANPTAPKGLQTVQGSRYSTSTSNALYSSNLRDDTKVILEQISANSQKNRAESAKVQHASTSENVTPGESEEKVTPESDKTDSDKKQQFGISSRFSNSIKNKGKAQATPDYVDPLIKRMDSFRKEKRVYSRFEVFYKKDDSLKTEDNSAGQQGDESQDCKDIDSGDKKKASKIIPKLLETLKRF
ncbi:protein FAM83H-like [Stegostoma tigrinum]|uniref:protein FAM83H-like n=1 Tax=Stegostoma tigrinum TaxID=3053191 RepID=UPI0028700D45|nr:protein FAM83H-like [Stegostoma tigrinum]XP_059496858.1 protein FAM83H-like [Stegostoma tigrinum]XP_059496859.1 protein FAM83H-like [Stegostoma tigrinum]XP_059496861.1 protein FAM83H-like [Stegostoma tigrinum]XP_059496863.1 protein FAM83H-like [Stegostoma tigrinum]